MEAVKQKYKAYDEYKTSDIDWLGNYPSNWREGKIIYYSKLKTGGTPNKNNLEYWEEGTINWMSSGEVNKKIIYKVNNQITEEGYKNSNATFLPVNTVMMALNGQGKTKGTVAILKTISTCNQSLAGFICDEKNLHYKYLYYYFESNYRKIRGLVGDGLREGLSLSLLKSLYTYLPSINEQQMIASFLDRETIKLDKLVGKKERLIKLLKEKRQAIISQAVTKGINPNVPINDSGIEWLGEIPDRWDVSRLGYEYRVKARLGWKGLKASEYVDDGYIFLSTPNIKDHEIDFENVNYITEERYIESPEIMLELGDVLLAKDGSTLGIANVIRELPSPATVNSSIAVLRARKKAHSIYLYYFLRSNYMQHIIQRFKDGMGVPHLFQRDINKFNILVPPIEEQKSIGQYLDRQTMMFNKAIEKLNLQITKIKEYRQSLISAAVTGKIDVRDEV